MVKVLLADDDFTMVALLKTLLGIEGYQVATLLDKTGDLLDNIRHEKPDVLLIDIFLGGYNGMNVVRQIRAMPDMKDLKIVMVSGIDRAEECLTAGANAFLLKPYMPEDLFDLLRS
ncbi:MAG: response regulator [Chloroflexi bacterium]|nr:response regulator [Chloroflexota bacterium]